MICKESFDSIWLFERKFPNIINKLIINGPKITYILGNGLNYYQEVLANERFIELNQNYRCFKKGNKLTVNK
jgi:hypothetical protein